MRLSALLLLMLSLTTAAFGFDRMDLSSRWIIARDSIEGLSNHNLHVIHFQLFQADSGALEIAGNKGLSIFINDQLVFNGGKQARWRLDSLKAIYIFPITITCFRKPNGSINTSLINHSVQRDEQYSSLSLSTTSAFVLSLLWVLIFLIRSNSAVLLEYFNFLKVFAVRYLDEGLLVQRITSFNNIYVFAFCSGLIAINLISFDPSTFGVFKGGGGSAWFEVLILMTGIFGLLLLKIIFLNLAARLFKLTEFAPSQFFNFVKILLGCFCISSIGAVTIFIFGADVERWRNMFFGLVLILLGLFLLTTFLKLINKGGLTVFHLFSYLCVSEIFPMVFLLKIYYF